MRDTLKPTATAVAPPITEPIAPIPIPVPVPAVATVTTNDAIQETDMWAECDQWKVEPRQRC